MSNTTNRLSVMQREYYRSPRCEREMNYTTSRHFSERTRRREASEGANRPQSR